MNEKILLEEIKKLKINLSKEADSFEFLKQYLIDKGILNIDFEFELQNHLNSIYVINGDLIIEEYNIEEIK